MKRRLTGINPKYKKPVNIKAHYVLLKNKETGVIYNMKKQGDRYFSSGCFFPHIFESKFEAQIAYSLFLNCQHLYSPIYKTITITARSLK